MFDFMEVINGNLFYSGIICGLMLGVLAGGAGYGLQMIQSIFHNMAR